MFKKNEKIEIVDNWTWADYAWDEVNRHQARDSYACWSNFNQWSSVWSKNDYQASQVEQREELERFVLL